MARKERNDVDYFPHNVNHGKKMFFIENKYGNDGYATWFKLLEELGKASHHYLNINDDMTLMFLSATCRVSVERLQDILMDLNRLGEFDKELFEMGILFNTHFVESVQDAYKKRNNSCVTKNQLVTLLQAKGITIGGISNPNKGKGASQVSGNTQSKVNYTKEEDSKEDVNTLTSPELPSATPAQSLAGRVRNFVKVFNDEKKTASGTQGKFTDTSKVVEAFKTRIKKYSAADILKAVRAAFRHDYHIEHNFIYLTPEYILRENILDRYINMADMPDVPKTSGEKLTYQAPPKAIKHA